jgi:hypothetical protein
VVEVAEEVVGEELLSGAELAAGSVGSGDNRSKMPLVRHSRRKTTAGKSCGPASLAGAAGRLLVQEGHCDEALLLAQSDSSGWLMGDGQRWAKQRPVRSRASRSAVERERGKAEWATTSSVTSGVVVRRGQHMWAATTGGHREQGRRAGPGDRPGGQTKMGR